MRYVLFLPFLLVGLEPSALYLSWEQDPTTSIAIQWHSESEEPLSFSGPDDNWYETNPSTKTIENVNVHTIRLKDLTPDTDYSFVIGDSKLYRFRTAPKTLAKTFRLVFANDIYASPKAFRRLSKMIMQHAPHVAVLIGEPLGHSLKPFATPMKEWCSFLKDWKHHMCDVEGRIGPFLLLPRDANEPFFSLFSYAQKKLYRTCDVGSFLSLTLLDSSKVVGRQTSWLKSVLQKRKMIPYRLALFQENEEVISEWQPLLDEHNVPKIYSLGKKGKKLSAVLVELTESSAIAKTLDLLNHSSEEMGFSPSK